MSDSQMEQKYLTILGQALAASSLRMTASGLQKCLQSLRHLEEIYDTDEFKTPEGASFLESWIDRIKDLWNYTARSELGGRPPTRALLDLLERGASAAELRACPIHVPSDFP